MGGVCSAVNCSNSSSKDVRLYKFPKNAILRKIWLKQCGRENWQPEYTPKLCSVHFEEYQFVLDANGKKQLNPIAVPTLFDFTNSSKVLKSKRKKYHYKTMRESNSQCSISSSQYERMPPYEEGLENNVTTSYMNCDLADYEEIIQSESKLLLEK